MNSEMPLVFFTVLTQLGAGLTLFGAWRTVRGGTAPRALWLAALAAAGLGLAVSTLHLSSPFRAAEALRGLDHSWLSREGLAFGALCALLAVNVWKPGRAAALLAGLCALAGLLMQGLTYAPVSMPAIANGLPFALFTLTALSLGACCADSLNEGGEDSLEGARKVCLLLLLLCTVCPPCLWASGGAVMQDTAALWLASAPFWIGTGLIAAALVLTFVGGTVGARRLQAVMLLGVVVLTRMTFFGATVHTAARLGMPY